jgi:glycosyltransferase involved in cell wall biosynthesis
MKIGIDARTLLDKNYSGVSEYSYNLIKNILQIDKKNEYIFYINSFSDLPPSLKNIIGKHKLIHTRYPNRIFNYGMQKILQKPKIDELLGKVDLFFMPHINFASFSDKTKKIITIHDLSFLRNRKFFSFRKNIWHQNLNVKKLIKQFDHVIAISENTKNDIMELCGVDEKKIKVIYSGILNDFEKINKDNPELIKVQKKYNLNQDFIFYLGTLEPRKNIGGLIKAYEKFLELDEKNKKYDLVLAGAWGWKCKETKKVWENSKYKNKIKFLGYVEAKEKKYLYNLSSLFIYPSFYEGFGFPPLEALFCGTKVITSFSSSMPEISKSLFILVNPYDLNSLAFGIQEGIKSLNISELKIENIKKNLNWEKTALLYLDLFQN